MLQHFGQSPPTGATGSLSLQVGLSSFSFYPICHWGSEPSLCSHNSVLTSLKLLEGGKVGTLTFYLDCVGGTLYLFNWSRPSWLGHFLLRTFTHILLPLLWHRRVNPGGCFGPLLCTSSLFAENFKLAYYSQYVACSVCFSPWGEVFKGMSTNPKFIWYTTCYCQLSLKALFSFN